MPLLFLGDFLYDYDERPKDLEILGRRFRASDYHVVLNLEGSLRDLRCDESRAVILHHSESFAPILKDLNVVAVNIANNHIMDWGEDGLSRLLETLDRNDVPCFGAGTDLAAAVKPLVVSESGCRVGLLGFGWDFEGCIPARLARGGVAPLDEGLVLQAIEESRPAVDCLVVCFHWGYEYELLPLPLHRHLARSAVSAGADMVIGHHPHVVQAIESYLGKTIYYSLGNFYFGSRRKDFTTLNSVAAKHSQVGMGVVLSLEPELATRRLFFRYARHGTDDTEIAPEDLKVEDISSIPMEDYNRYFESHRTTTWKPSLRYGALERQRNRLRLLQFRIHNRTVGLVKAVGMYNRLKRLRIWRDPVRRGRG